MEASQVARMDYAERHRDRYLQWCYEVERSPYSVLAKTEFAIISAHTPQAAAIEGFLAAQREHSLRGIAEALDVASVLAPRKKAAWIDLLRERTDTEDVLPSGLASSWRKRVKIKGLGITKSSFAADLADPLHADVICLDTHMCRVAGLPWRWLAVNEGRYRATELAFGLEAEEVGLPIFVYAWATWDFARRDRHEAPDDHSFLWRGGRTKFQLKLFT